MRSRGIILLLCATHNSYAWPISSTGRLVHRDVRLYAAAKEPAPLDENNSMKNKQTRSLDQVAWTLPPLLAAVAYGTYSDTSRAFYDWIQHLAVGSSSSSSLLSPGDSTMMAGSSISISNDMVETVLSGPVTLSVSILFGTLVAMTIQTLYDRQRSIHKELVSQIEEVHDTQLLLQGFPEPFKTRGLVLLQTFVSEWLHQFELGQVTAETVRERHEISLLLLLLNDVSQQQDQQEVASLSEVYSAIQRFKDIRSNLIAALQTTFSPAHYGNMVLLAVTLLFVFLLETSTPAQADSNATLLTFQLRICWAVLIGTYTMLAVVIYDLCTPWSGIFQTVPTLDLEDVELYALIEQEEIAEMTNDVNTNNIGS